MAVSRAAPGWLGALVMASRFMSTRLCITPRSMLRRSALPILPPSADARFRPRWSPLSPAWLPAPPPPPPLPADGVVRMRCILLRMRRRMVPVRVAARLADASPVSGTLMRTSNFIVPAGSPLCSSWMLKDTGLWAWWPGACSCLAAWYSGSTPRASVLCVDVPMSDAPRCCTSATRTISTRSARSSSSTGFNASSTASVHFGWRDGTGLRGR
mmetsp:Transcript_30491/g.90403  ORF Transcript_30491/g.90403 Transcript_30491/m.90403 type:complete len:213 (+) Transcript_30491:78-716(+)